MNTKETEKLLEQFYNGITDETEEKRLTEYFCSNEVDKQLRKEGEIFLALQQNKSIEVPFDLESKIERQINQWNTIESTARKTARKANLRWIIGICASILLLIGVGIFIDKNGNSQLSDTEKLDTYDNPEDAYATANKALTKFSVSINKGLKTINNATNLSINK
ncbi:hypothetical protein [Prevotella aurantiaca]|uniref:hypothetical protein n=1 Tax=Prevotella aurantiaca TaxID=596085 RepID=UPI0028E24553|nr:hypothetical protein [Prevotella aurantiaca]